jgi:hypothetical protein
VNGAGCGSIQAGNQMYLNAGVSASSKGFDQSTYTIYSFDTDGYSSGSSNLLNKPEPTIIFKDQTNMNATNITCYSCMFIS